MKAIRVSRDDSGLYSLPSAAQAEDWNEVIVGAADVTLREKLRGWNEYTAAYDVSRLDDDVAIYFVAEDLRAYHAPTGFDSEYSQEHASFFRPLPQGAEIALVVDVEHRLALVLTEEASGLHEQTPSLMAPFASQKAIDELGRLILEAVQDGEEIFPSQQLWLDRVQNR